MSTLDTTVKDYDKNILLRDCQTAGHEINAGPLARG